MRRTISFVVSVAIAAASTLGSMTASGVIGQNFEGLGPAAPLGSGDAAVTTIVPSGPAKS